MGVTQRPDNLPIAGGALENLINKVSKMEMKVLFKSECEMKNLERNYEKKCRYEDKGYCKYKSNCKFYHPGQICEKFLRDGKCESGQTCNNRHPRKCRYWKGGEGCNRQQACKYLHDQGDNYKPMASDADNVDKHSEKTFMETDENVVENNNINTDSKIV